MADLATLQTWLDAAETAKNKLMTGSQTVEVTVDGQSVKYTPARIGALNAYICELKSQLGQGRRRPLSPRFSG